MGTLVDNAYKSKVPELCLKKANPEQRDKVVIWVEGNDKRIYRNFFKENMVIIQGGCGCDELEDCYNQWIKKTPSQKSILIRDADFKRLEKEDMSTNANIFHTDGHDLEMMMIKSEKVRERICVTYECPNDRNDFYDSIFDDLELISYFKWYNYHYNRCYCFKGFKIQGGLNDDTFNNFKKIEDKVRQHSQSSWKKKNPNKPFEVIKPEDVSKFKKEHSSVDRYELTNGHDYLNGLCHQIKNKTEYALNEDRLKDPIIASFDLSEFQKTSLYKSLSNWGKKNNVNFLKS